MSIESIGNALKPIGEVVGAIGGIAGDVGSAVNVFQGLTGGGSQTRYLDMAGSNASAQQRIAERQSALAREQWDAYKRDFLPLAREQAAEARRDIGLFRPLKQAAVAEGLAGLRRTAPLESAFAGRALEGVRPDLAGAAGAAAAEVRSSFDKVRDKQSRERRKFGPQPGLLQYMERMTDLDEAAAEAAARTRAARDEKARAEDLSWQRLSQAMNLRQGLPGVPSSSLAPARAADAGDVAGQVGGLLAGAAKGYESASKALAQAHEFEAERGIGLRDILDSATDLADAWSGTGGLPGRSTRRIF